MENLDQPIIKEWKFPAPHRAYNVEIVEGRNLEDLTDAINDYLNVWNSYEDDPGFQVVDIKVKVKKDCAFAQILFTHNQSAFP